MHLKKWSFSLNDWSYLEINMFILSITLFFLLSWDFFCFLHFIMYVLGMYHFWWFIRYILEKEMATHSNTLAWKIPWTEKPGRLQSMGLQRVRQDWTTSLTLDTYYILFLLVVTLYFPNNNVWTTAFSLTMFKVKYKSIIHNMLIH